MFGWQNGISYISKKGDSAEIGFCKALKYKGIDGALLLQGVNTERRGDSERGCRVESIIRNTEISIIL